MAFKIFILVAVGSSSCIKSFVDLENMIKLVSTV